MPGQDLDLRDLDPMSGQALSPGDSSSMPPEPPYTIRRVQGLPGEVSDMLKGTGCSNLVLRHKVEAILGDTGQHQAGHEDYVNGKWVPYYSRRRHGAQGLLTYSQEGQSPRGQAAGQDTT